MTKVLLCVGVWLVSATAWAAPTLTVNGSAGPITVGAGSTITIVAANLAANDSNIVALFAPGTANSQNLTWVYLTGNQTLRSGHMTGVTTTFTLPPAPGTFEVRAMHWVSGTGYVTDATSGTVTVQSGGASPTLTVNGSAGPITVGASSTITIVAANLAANDSNIVALFAPGTANSQNLTWVYLTGNQILRSGHMTGVTTTFTLPPAPGTFEVRALHWIVGTGYVTDATSSLVTVSTSPGSSPPPTSTPCGVNPESAQSGNWSDPETWGGCLPTPTDHATIAGGHTVIVDGTVAVTEVLVHGRLAACRTCKSLLDVGSVIVLAGGTLDYGTATSPIPAGISATILLRDLPNATFTHLHGQPGLQPVLHAHGGAIEMQGSGPAVPWMPLSGDVPAGGVTLDVNDDLTGWRVGDTVLVTGTVKLELDRDPVQSEERVIASVEGHRLTLTVPLTHAHGGVQPSAECRTCRQAVVANLTRNVLVTSAYQLGRRGHVHLATDIENSATGQQPTVHISDAAFVSLGRPEVGSYGGPHLHILGVAKDAHVRRSVIRDSANVWVRVHGTHFATIADNIGVFSVGNGFSTEDGSEAYNVFHHNLAVLAYPATVMTNPNDPFDKGEGAGFWANSPRNIWTGNVAVENIWGFQIQRGGEGEPHPVPTVDAQGMPVVVDIRAAPLLRFDGNTATGHTASGFEMAGGRSLEASVIDHFTALDNNSFSVAVFSFNTVFDHLYAANGGHGDVTKGDFHVNDIGMYLGQLNLTVRNSYLSALEIGYQNIGYVLLENVKLDLLLRSGFGAAETIISISGPTAATGGILYDVGLTVNGVVQPGTTASQQVVLWDYDGPGHHVMLGQDQTSAADTLTYATSSRFGRRTSFAGSMDSTWQEALFTGPYGQGPEFAWPLRIDVGNRPRGGIGQPNPTDLMVGGKRWRVDVSYVPSPPGTRLPRYGFTGAFPVFTPPIFPNPTQDATDAHLHDGTLLGSHRTARELRYTVDLPNGEYWVDLGWQESSGDAGSVSAVAGRVMDVSVQGVRQIQDLDVFSIVGVNAPLWRSFPATVTNERLWVDFKGQAGTGHIASVNAIAVCPRAMVTAGRCP